MRSSGILMPVFSLPSPYGIGTLGQEAFRFVDFLNKAGQRYWQILPLNPTNYGDSPYQSFSAFAGNPYFIDLLLLQEQGLLTPRECDRADCTTDTGLVDYGLLYRRRWPLLRLAYTRFTGEEAFDRFCREQAGWLEDYALFMALKDAHEGAPWREWAEPLRRRDPAAVQAAQTTYADDCRFYRFLQYLFYTQWHRLKACVDRQ